MPEIAVVLLAAGAATRFGSPKQLARLSDGRTMIEHAVDMGQSVAGDGNLYVLLGAYHEEIEPLIAGATVIVNADWKQGMGSSIACAARHVERKGHYDGVLFYLGDQVALEAGHLRRLCRAFEPDCIVCADYVLGGGKPGVPALFPAFCLSSLSALDGDTGARKLLHGDLLPVRTIAMPAAAVDVDTPADLSRILTSKTGC